MDNVIKETFIHTYIHIQICTSVLLKTGRKKRGNFTHKSFEGKKKPSFEGANDGLVDDYKKFKICTTNLSYG